MHNDNTILPNLPLRLISLSILAVLNTSTAVAQSSQTLPSITVTGASTASGHVDGYIAKRTATATKTDTPLKEVPQSVSVITADHIEATGATRIREALAYTPGVNVHTYGRDGRYEWIDLRGFNNNYPGFLMDGLGLLNSNFGYWRAETYALERIELMRGPSSVLYGQGQAGGVVNLVSKRPTTEHLRELKFMVGTDAAREIAADFSGKLTQNGKWLYRVTGQLHDGKLQHSNLPDDQYFIAPALTWQPTAHTSLTLLSKISRVRASNRWEGYPVIGTLYPNPNGKIPYNGNYADEARDRYDVDQTTVGYMFEHQLNDTWTLRQNLRYGKHDSDQNSLYHRNFVVIDKKNPNSPANFRLLNRYITDTHDRLKSFVVDNQAQATLMTDALENTILVGLDFQRNRIDAVTTYGQAAPIDVYNPVHDPRRGFAPKPTTNSDTTIKQTGFYLQDQLKWNERWTATLGARYDHYNRDILDRNSNRKLSNSSGRWTSRLGMVYLAPNGVSPYFSYSESFYPSSELNTQGKPFDDETGQQYELGLRYQPTGREDQYTFAIFDVRRQNYVTRDENRIPHQTGEVTVRGVELEALLKPIDNMNLTLSYSFTPKSEVTASSNTKEIGTSLNPVPEHQLAAWSDYRFNNGFKAGIGVRYTGKNNGARVKPGKLEVPSFVLFDAMIGYSNGPWDFALNIRNLTDKEYLTQCSPYGCYFGNSRRANATLTYRW